MTTNRFHKAAKDNLVEILKETTKRDCNSKDEQGMTPTLYAAFHGHLDALRVLCGRGGDPNKSDLFGNTALHLAAAQGHKHIVTFLVNFGANIYTTDIDGRTPHELAGINGREEILKYLDGVQGKLEATDKKKAKTMQDKAKEDAKKRVKKFNDRMKQREETHGKLEKKRNLKPSMMESLRSRFIGGSMSNLTSDMPERRKTYSDIIAGNNSSNKGTMSMLQRKIISNKNNKLGQNDDDFKISGIEDGRRSMSSIKGIRRGSEVLLGGTLEKSTYGKRGTLNGIFNDTENTDIDNIDSPPREGRLTRSLSQPGFINELGKDGENQEPSSIFIRPGVGSIVIRKSVSNAFGGFYGQPERENSNGFSESYNHTRQSDDDISVSDSSEEEDEDPNAALERFLNAFGLSEYLPKFLEEKIDLDILLKLTESDIKSLRLPVGSHRKLVNAIKERNSVFENSGDAND